jgi:hypothetical protein
MEAAAASLRLEAAAAAVASLRSLRLELAIANGPAVVRDADGANLLATAVQAAPAVGRRRATKQRQPRPSRTSCIEPDALR